MKPIGTLTPTIRGSSKIIESGCPLKPILCMKNLRYHKLARWLVDIPDPIRKTLTPHCVKDSLELTQILENVTLTSQKMLSIDVNSLFTNNPPRGTVNFLCEFISLINISHPIPRNYLRELIFLHEKYPL